MLIGAAVAAVILIAAVLIIGPGGAEGGKFKAEIQITTGATGGQQIKSNLKCDGNKASGDGMYRFPGKAKAGCRQLQNLEGKITTPQQACPANTQSGPQALLIKGKVNDKPVLYEHKSQITCQGRADQINQLVPFIKTAQAAPKPPSFTVIVSPPDPPALTEADQAKAEAEIKKSGWKRYQQKMASELKKLKKSGKGLAACPRPLPEVFVTCYVEVEMRPDENQQEAMRRAFKENPDWFNNSTTPQYGDAVGRIVKQRQQQKIER